MPKCTERKLDLGRLGRRVIEADFSGGGLSTEGGALLAALAYSMMIDLRRKAAAQGCSRKIRASAPRPTPQPAPSPPPLAVRNDFRCGERVAFEHKHPNTVEGVIVRINQRTASIDLGDGTTSRVGFSLLRQVVDI